MTQSSCEPGKEEASRDYAAEPRERSLVVFLIMAALSTTDAMGAAVEPIAQASDAHDQAPGDYVVRASFWVHENEGRVYAAVHELHFYMDVMRFADPVVFERSLLAMIGDVITVRDQAYQKVGQEGVSFIGEGYKVNSLSEVIRETERRLDKHTKH